MILSLRERRVIDSTAYLMGWPDDPRMAPFSWVVLATLIQRQLAFWHTSGFSWLPSARSPWQAESFAL